MLFCSTLLLHLNLLKYWWSMTHSLPRHGRFWYLTETMTKSQCSTQQTLLKSDVKNKDISNILVKMKEKTCTFSEHFDQIFNLKRKILLFINPNRFTWSLFCPWHDFVSFITHRWSYLPFPSTSRFGHMGTPNNPDHQKISEIEICLSYKGCDEMIKMRWTV